jgi:IclR family transcriptional regulator, KDG regulon repressor
MKIARTTSGKYVVEAVAKALDVLDAFENSGGLSLNEISQRVGCNKSRTFRLLYTLVARGYVQRSADGTSYRLGTKLVERASNVHRNLKDIARGFMLQVQEEFNETVNLSVLDDTGNVLYVDIVESSRPFRMTATVGCRLPAHLTSMGKAILASMSIDDPDSPDHVVLKKLTPRPSRTLGKELAKIRQRGYAIDNEESEPGVACIGVPILDGTGRPVAAMSVSGSLHRILTGEKKIADALLMTAKRISVQLGSDNSISRQVISSAGAEVEARYARS